MLVLTKDIKKLEALRLVIKRKKSILAILSSRYELLKLELEQIKREYSLRVGSLLERDNALDFEIINHKNILSYLETGFSYKQALEKTIGKYYAEQNERTEDDAYYAEATVQYIKSGNNKKQKLRQLWKKAVMKFHPDLASDPEEKKSCEEIMKKVNQAYADFNLQALQDIFTNSRIAVRSELTLEELVKLLVDLENKIIKVRKEHNALKSTEWYGWKSKMKSAKKSGTDLFKEIEESLIDDIVRKMRILTELKKSIEDKDNLL